MWVRCEGFLSPSAVRPARAPPTLHLAQRGPHVDPVDDGGDRGGETEQPQPDADERRHAQDDEPQRLRQLARGFVRLGGPQRRVDEDEDLEQPDSEPDEAQQAVERVDEEWHGCPLLGCPGARPGYAASSLRTATARDDRYGRTMLTPARPRPRGASARPGVPTSGRRLSC